MTNATHHRTVRLTIRFTLSVITFMSVGAAAFASPPHCSSAPLINLGETLRGETLLGETLRGESLSAGEPDCFRLRTPAAGFLMVDLLVPGTAAAEPRLGLLGPRCERSAAVDVIEQSASHLLVSSDAMRELTVCVGAQDPRQELGVYKLHAAFLDFGLLGNQKAEQAEADPDPFSDCFNKAEQAEADPDPFSDCFNKAEQAEADPDPFSDCFNKAEQAEADPDPFSGSDPAVELCRARELDDHSDSRLCATAIELGRGIRGEIGNPWGDDHDVFVFELTAAQTVRLETSGEVDTLGTLYDRRGQRLAAADDGGASANFRLVKTLQPGVYFVGIEGVEWSRGAYDLAIEAIERSW